MIHFTMEAWEQYLYWQAEDRGMLKRINQLIRDCMRDPFHGIGKPEPLKKNLTGFWSRRIDDEIGWSTSTKAANSSLYPAGFIISG